MSFFLLILALSALAYGPQFFLGDRQDYRMAMRHGMAGGFTLTGVDHFVHAHQRYVPMLPDVLANYALALVYVTGAAELAGAIGLVIPLAIYRRLGLPNLRGSGQASGLRSCWSSWWWPMSMSRSRAATCRGSNLARGIIGCVSCFSRYSSFGHSLLLVFFGIARRDNSWRGSTHAESGDRLRACAAPASRRG
jgi:DoxX-like family